MTKTGRKLSRRKILAGGGAAVAVGALAAVQFRTQIVAQARAVLETRGVAPRAVSLATGSYNDWLAKVGTVFSLGGGTNLRLTGVRPLTSTGTRPAGVARSQAFLAVFDALAGTTLAGDLIYTAANPQSGPLSIFLSASPDPTTPARMLAVFN